MARSSDSLMPLLVAGSGRSGTTFMQLLGSSPRIVFDDVYAFEHSYLAYFLQLAEVAQIGAKRHEGWERATLYPSQKRERRHHRRHPWGQRQLLEVEGQGAFWKDMFLATWETFSQRATAKARQLRSNPALEPVYHAEKAPHWLPDRTKDVIDVKTIYLVRDPRDQWMSITSFNEKRGRFDFGQRPEDTPASFAKRLAESQERVPVRRRDSGGRETSRSPERVA